MDKVKKLLGFLAGFLPGRAMVAAAICEAIDKEGDELEDELVELIKNEGPAAVKKVGDRIQARAKAKVRQVLKVPEPAA